MSEDFLRDVKTLLASGRGDAARLREILDSIKQGNPVYMSDYKYVANLADAGGAEEAATHDEGARMPKSGNPLDLLRIRLAEGKITIDEFRQIKKEISGF